MKLVLRPYVEHELETAGDWYEERRPGLKRQFLEAVEEAFSHITENPLLYQTVHLEIRRATLNRFPYGVY